jgi:hypothetical protein
LRLSIVVAGMGRYNYAASYLIISHARRASTRTRPRGEKNNVLTGTFP